MLFTRDRNFYKTLFHLMMIVVFQNIIAYSINMADNLMLGMYSQSSLSGVATVNQIQFLLQQMTLAIGDTLVIIASQYWGQKKTKPIRTFTGIALATGLILGLIVFILTTLFPREILMLFTKRESYIIQGMDYLSLIRFTYPLFVLSTILMAALRSVKGFNFIIDCRHTDQLHIDLWKIWLSRNGNERCSSWNIDCTYPRISDRCNLFNLCGS